MNSAASLLDEQIADQAHTCCGGKMKQARVVPGRLMRHECPSGRLLLLLLASLVCVAPLSKAAGEPAGGAAIQPADLVVQVKANCSSLGEAECARRVLTDLLRGMDVHLGLRLLPLTGQQVATVKIVDQAKGIATGFAYDGTGAILADNGRSLRQKETEAYLANYGRVSQDLLAQTWNAQSFDPIPVAIWLKTYEDYPDKTGLMTNKSLLECFQTEHADYVAEVQSSFHAGLQQAAPEIAERLHYVPGAPAATAVLTSEEISFLAEFSEVATIFYNPSPEALAYDDPSYTWVETVESDTLAPDGNGFPVCVIEECTPYNGDQFVEIVGIYDEGLGQCYSEHAEMVCGIIRNDYVGNPHGVAEGSGCYFANFGDWPEGDPWQDLYDQLGPAVNDGCVQGSYKVWSYQYKSNHFIDMYFDYMAKHSPYPIVVVAAGNSVDGLDTLGWNVISVGATDDANTSSRSDDIMWDEVENCPPCGCAGSASMNPLSDQTTTLWDQELPLLVAPGSRIRAVGYEGDGTSMSAPMVAGVASILMEVNSELVGWPEIVRSILMATASNDVDRGFLDSDDCWRYDNGSWYCGAEVGPEGLRERDDRDGAGEVSAFVAAFLSLGDFHVQHNNSPVKWGWDYGWMGYYQDFNGDNSWWVKNYYIDANSWGWPIRVVLSWDATATCSDVEDPGTCFSPTYLLDFDLDLYVYDTTTGGIVASSLSQYNSYEFVQFSPTPGRTYRIAVKLYDHNYSSTYFGLAWSSWPFVNN